MQSEIFLYSFSIFYAESEMEESSNFNTKFLTMLLNISGVALPDQKYATYVNIMKYYLVYAFTLLTSAQLALLGRASTLVELSITVVFINSGLFLNSTTLILNLKKKFIMNIFHSINSDFIHPVTIISDVAPSSLKFRKFFFNTGIPGICMYVFSTCGTVLLFPFSDHTYDNINALLVPRAFPWTVHSKAKYWATVALEFSWLSALSAPVLLNFMFGIYYMFEIQVQYEILSKMIEKFDQMHECISLVDSSNCISEQKMIQSFVCCIRHHQNIIKFVIFLN